jgi:hypothetical protein
LLRVLFVDQRPARDVIDTVGVPTLLLWGDRDPLIGRAVIDDLVARRPDWDLLVFETVGHLAPWEVPDDYVDAVGRWLADHEASRPAARRPQPEEHGWGAGDAGPGARRTAGGPAT